MVVDDPPFFLFALLNMITHNLYEVRWITPLFFVQHDYPWLIGGTVDYFFFLCFVQYDYPLI
jgi:hypothetical protein